MRNSSNNLFWTSYSDLMTAMFIVTLVLFVLSYNTLKKEKELIETELQKLKKIEEIERALNALDTAYFLYKPEYKRHQLRVDVQFESNKAIITKGFKLGLRKAGEKLNSKIQSLKSEKDVKFLIIIEGNAQRSNDNHIKFREQGYILSYKRALALYEFWTEEKIILDEDIVEVIIAGSGHFGKGRDTQNEVNNRRFQIQIIPKIGEFNK